MGFLQKLLPYRHIVIQCHNFPDSDTVGAAYSAYRYLTEKGIEAEMIYGGPTPIDRREMQTFLKECRIPLTYTHTLPACDLLLVIDGQYGQSNVEKFEAPAVAMIDHHVRVAPESELTLIRSDYQSCSTIMWELLSEEGFDVEADPLLVTALLYGLYIDTSHFTELYHAADIHMKTTLKNVSPVLDQLMKSQMTAAEFMVAAEAMGNIQIDPLLHCAVVPAIKCSQAVLGIIGDFVINIDIVSVSVVYSLNSDGWRVSVRSSDRAHPANQIVRAICEGIGSGGGHWNKSAGRLDVGIMEKAGLGEDVIFERLQKAMEA